MLAKMKVNAQKTREAAQRGFANATDLADYLARKGVPFRQAHHSVGHLVNYCIKHETDFEHLPLDVYRGHSDLIEDDVYEAIALETCVKVRRSYGGTAPECVKEQIARAKAILAAA